MNTQIETMDENHQIFIAWWCLKNKGFEGNALTSKINRFARLIRDGYPADYSYAEAARINRQC